MQLITWEPYQTEYGTEYRRGTARVFPCHQHAGLESAGAGWRLSIRDEIKGEYGTAKKAMAAAPAITVPGRYLTRGGEFAVVEVLNQETALGYAPETEDWNMCRWDPRTGENKSHNWLSLDIL